MPRVQKLESAAHDDDLEAWNYEDASELQRPKDLSQYEILVSSRDWTVETVVQQIKAGNIDLDPAFQRRNAWKDNRRSRLIESFILGFPVPQIVFAENPRRRSTFIVIDGKQRLMTIAGLYLPAYRDYWKVPKFVGLGVLKDLNRVSIDSFLADARFAGERRQLANADIRTTLISGFSSEDVLYDIFYRINTGSVPLSSQELRQVLNRGDFSKYLLETTSENNALWVLLGIDKPDPRLRDVELLLRLIAWKKRSEVYQGNMKPFLDSTMEALNRNWDAERGVVERMVGQLLQGVDALTKIFGENAARKYKDGKFETSLNRALFEVQVYYFALPGLRAAALRAKKPVIDAFKVLSENVDFLNSIESTTKSIENYRTRFELYRSMLRKVLKVEAPLLPLESRRR